MEHHSGAENTLDTIFKGNPAAIPSYWCTREIRYMVSWGLKKEYASHGGTTVLYRKYLFSCFLGGGGNALIIVSSYEYKDIKYNS